MRRLDGWLFPSERTPKFGTNGFIYEDIRAVYFRNSIGQSTGYVTNEEFHKDGMPLAFPMTLAMCDHRVTPCRQGRTGEAGFTLTELMMVVVIMAVITVFAAPNFIAWQAKSHLRQGVSELHGDFNLARMAAMNRNSTVTVTMSGGAGAAVRATFVDAGGSAVLPPLQMLAQVTGWAGTPVVVPFTVRFNSLGLRVGGGAGNQVITLTNSRGLTYEIQITAAGKARWCATSPCP